LQYFGCLIKEIIKTLIYIDMRERKKRSFM